MPNEAKSHNGSSLKQNLSTAARMTKQQTAARKEGARGKVHARPASDAPTAAKPAKAGKANKASKTEAKKAKTEAKRAKKDKGLTKRSAAKEGVKREKGATKDASTASLLWRMRVPLIIVAAIVLAVVIIYPVAQPYYVAMRDGQRQEAQIAAVEARNAELGAENEALKTDEGIEAQARKDYGYVKEGDKSAVVTNVGEGSSSGLPDQVDVDEIKAPQSWYYSILDTVFFYSS